MPEKKIILLPISMHPSKRMEDDLQCLREIQAAAEKQGGSSHLLKRYLHPAETQAPVSYTHLDVYKRQGHEPLFYGSPWHHAWANAEPASCKPSVGLWHKEIAMIKEICANAVAGTKKVPDGLDFTAIEDVYKRQA